MTKHYLNDLTYQVIGAAIEVHKELGPGLLESVYQKYLEREMFLREIRFKAQRAAPVIYKDLNLDVLLRYDLLIDDSLIVELKVTEGIHPIHLAQLLTYMKLLNKPKGILINFNSTNIFKNGQRTVVNKQFENLPEH